MAVPHSLQKRCVAVAAAPQFGQARASDVPHEPQNFWPGFAGAPHVEQVMSGQGTGRRTLAGRGRAFGRPGDTRGSMHTSRGRWTRSLAALAAAALLFGA